MIYSNDERPRAFQTMLSEMKSFFWDTDIEALDMDQNAPYIISRLLNTGGMAGYCWVKGLYSDQAIIDAVIHRRNLRPIVRNFMAQQYHIPRESLVTAPAWR